MTSTANARSSWKLRAATVAAVVMMPLQLVAMAALLLEVVRLIGPGAPTVPGIGIVGGIEREAAHTVALGKAAHWVPEAWIVHLSGRDFQGEVRFDAPPAFRTGDVVTVALRRTDWGTEVVAIRPQAAVEGDGSGLHGRATPR